MIKKLRVAVDHGNRNMKTCNFVFTTGLTEQDKKPARGESGFSAPAPLQWQIRSESRIGSGCPASCLSGTEFRFSLRV